MSEESTPRTLSTRRAMGIETEFGIVHASDEERSRSGVNASIALSHFAVAAYALLADSDRRRVRWDYGDETPLRDARGFELQRAAAHPTQLTDEVHDAHVPSVDLDIPVSVGEDPPADLDDSATLRWAARRAVSNAVLRNGARLYVDHAHPEYSSPEVMTAREAVVYDKAGEVIAERAMEIIDRAHGVPGISLYKNNTDGKGQSYGCHENFLVDRAVAFDRLTEILIPFFASRQILVGAGRVGIGTRSEKSGFQISSRADFFEAEVGLETTLNRPIVNSRDESHADSSRFRRLHVIIGDSNLSEVSTYLKLGMTSLVLALAEREHAEGVRYLPEIRLANPVEATHVFSHDLSLTERVDTADGGSMTGLEIQRAYLGAITSVIKRDGASPDEETAHVLELWERILDGLENDDPGIDPLVEWRAKRALLESYRARHGLEYSSAPLRALDLHYADLRPGRSLARKLEKSGRLARLTSDEEIEHAVLTPPASTRAYMRGMLVTHHRENLDSAGWDAVTLRHGGGALRLRFADPAQGSAAWASEHGIDPAADLNTLSRSLTQLSAPTMQGVPS